MDIADAERTVHRPHVRGHCLLLLATSPFPAQGLLFSRSHCAERCPLLSCRLERCDGVFLLGNVLKMRACIVLDDVESFFANSFATSPLQ